MYENQAVHKASVKKVGPPPGPGRWLGQRRGQAKQAQGTPPARPIGSKAKDYGTKGPGGGPLPEKGRLDYVKSPVKREGIGVGP